MRTRDLVRDESMQEIRGSPMEATLSPQRARQEVLQPSIKNRRVLSLFQRFSYRVSASLKRMFKLIVLVLVVWSLTHLPDLINECLR